MAIVRSVFHADLSQAHRGETYWLSANGVDYELTPHDHHTRSAARNAAPSLRHVDDARLTHFTPHVELGDSVLRVHLKHTVKTFPNAQADFGVHHVAIHFPTAAHQNGRIHHHPVDWLSTARALIFHHPEIMTKDPELAAIIHEYMDNATIHSMFVKLAEQMADLGVPSETDGWARLVPFTPPANAETRMDGRKTFYQHRPTQAIVDAAGPVMTAMLRLTSNDLRLKGKKWQEEHGTSVEHPVSHPKRFFLGNAAGTDTWKAALAHTDSIDGLEYSIDRTDPTSRKLSLSFVNRRIRYLGLYIRFYDINGKAISVPHWRPSGQGVADDIIGSSNDFQYDDLRYLGYIEANDHILGIPVPQLPGRFDIDVEFPETAVSASLFGCGLGTGSNTDPKAPAVGGILTGLINLTIPTFMLGFQVATQTNKGLYEIVKKLTRSKAFVGAVLLGGIGYVVGKSAAHKKMDWHAFADLTFFLFNPAAGRLLLYVEEQVAEQKALEAIPFAGWILIAINIATGAAQLAQTISAIATSPWNIENKVATSITTTVALHPDPRHKAFPQAPARTHASYVVRMIYSGKPPRATREQTIAVADDSTAPVLYARFPDNTLGDRIKIEVDYLLTSEEDGRVWTAGRAATAFLDNNEVHATTVNLYLVQYPIPLDDKSIYRHTSLLTYQDGNFKWMPTANAPQATIGNRNNASSGNAIADWAGLTLSQRHAVLGMAWKAANLGITSCVSGVGGPLYAIQSLNIPGAPMQDVRFAPCGFEGQTQIITDPFPAKFLMENGQWKLGPDDKPLPDPHDQDLGAFYIDPTKAGIALEVGGGYHLRRLSIDGSGSFDFGAAKSWGRFQWFPDSFAVHPAGWVAGVSSQFGKIQVAQLAEGDDEDVPVARVYGGQALNDQRHGLLFHAVAAACAYDGTIFILEDAKQSADAAHKTTVARLQAFDLHGKPVSRFFDEAGQPSPVLPLLHPDDYTYLDLAAVGNAEMTYLYVLYYQGTGLSPSDYHVALYQYGKTKPAKNPLTITDSVAAAKVFVDMWHSMYTLNYALLTDGRGNVAGPPAGSGVRTLPSISEWLPPLPKSS